MLRRNFLETRAEVFPDGPSGYQDHDLVAPARWIAPPVGGGGGARELQWAAGTRPLRHALDYIRLT